MSQYDLQLYFFLRMTLSIIKEIVVFYNIKNVKVNATVIRAGIVIKVIKSVGDKSAPSCILTTLFAIFDPDLRAAIWLL